MTQIVRNLTRRKLRSCLTISGIVIGILALTTMGALANNFNALLDGGAKYYAGYVPVADSNSNGVSTGAILPLTKAQELEAVPGVARAFPTITVDAKPGSLNVVSIGLPDRIEANSSSCSVWYMSPASRALRAGSFQAFLPVISWPMTLAVPSVPMM